MPQLKPMLAEDVVSFETLRYPLYGSFKIDGVRAVMPHKELLPRSLKRFGNRRVAEHFERFAGDLAGLEGELTLGSDPAPAGIRLCNETTSVVATHDDPRAGQLHWWIFDLIDDRLPFGQRVAVIRQRFKEWKRPHLAGMRVHMIEQRLIQSAVDAEVFEREAVSLGYEGIVLKDPDGLYKFGRSTLRSQQFLRVKRFSDAEGKVIGFVERMKNNNEAKTNELGHKTRSSHKSNKTGAGTLGTLHVEMINGQFKGKVIEVGTGWDASTGQWIWDNKAVVTGMAIKVKYFGHGVKDLPRFPTFEGFRDPVDMS